MAIWRLKIWQGKTKEKKLKNRSQLLLEIILAFFWTIKWNSISWGFLWIINAIFFWSRASCNVKYHEHAKIWTIGLADEEWIFFIFLLEDAKYWISVPVLPHKRR